MRSQENNAGIQELERTNDSSNLQQDVVLRNNEEPESSSTKIQDTCSFVNPEDHLLLAHKVANEFRGIDDYDELYSICLLVMTKAVRTYNRDLAAFSNYAIISMRRAMLKHMKKMYNHREGMRSCVKKFGNKVLEGIHDEEIPIPSNFTDLEGQVARLRYHNYKPKDIMAMLTMTPKQYGRVMKSIRGKLEQKT